jgi:N utilization substance protein B
MSKFHQRHLGRELALLWLFQIDMGRQAPDAVMREVPDDLAGVEEEGVGFAQLLGRGVLAEQSSIDDAISKYAHGWSITRLAAIERNVLRIALYEIMHLPDVPASVSVDEAVELAKRYGSDESGKFVNGILGAYLRGEKGNPEVA